MNSFLWHSGLDSNIEPVQQLSLSNGSLSLLFLDGSDILYYNSTEDPWFSATTPASASPSLLSKARRPFYSDEPVGVLGCAVRRFYCNPTLHESTTCVDGFAEYNQTQDAITRIWSDVTEQAKMRAFISTLSTGGAGYLDALYAIPSVPTLLARNTVLGNMQTAALPKDHWQEEREYLYKASLAAIQSAVVEHARGLDLGRGPFCDNTTSCYRTCKCQVRKLAGGCRSSADPIVIENPVFKPLLVQRLDLGRSCHRRMHSDAHFNVCRRASRPPHTNAAVTHGETRLSPC